MVPLYEPIAMGLALLGAAAMAGMAMVVGLVALANPRPARPRVTVTPLDRRLSKAA